MTAREMTGLRHGTGDRRQREAGAPAGGSERRLRAERRDISVAPLSPGEWAEAACNYYYQHPAHGQKLLRWMAERRIVESPPPAAGGERRLCADRRQPVIASIPIEEWAEAMSNYYYHFHRR